MRAQHALLNKHSSPPTFNFVATPLALLTNLCEIRIPILYSISESPDVSVNVCVDRRYRCSFEEEDFTVTSKARSRLCKNNMITLGVSSLDVCITQCESLLEKTPKKTHSRKSKRSRSASSLSPKAKSLLRRQEICNCICQQVVVGKA